MRKYPGNSICLIQKIKIYITINRGGSIYVHFGVNIGHLGEDTLVVEGSQVAQQGSLVVEEGSRLVAGVGNPQYVDIAAVEGRHLEEDILVEVGNQLHFEEDRHLVQIQGNLKEEEVLHLVDT